MHANIWNIRNSKQRLGILERTYAQKRHLQNILLAKSTINCNTGKVSRNSPTTTQNRNVAGNTGENVEKRGTEASAKENNSYTKSPQRKDLSRNLKTYSSINRSMKKRQIEDENYRMVGRLLGVSATLKRERWARMGEQNQRYRENLNRRKHKQVDYSQEAIKLIKQSPKFKLIKMALINTTRSFDKLQHYRF